MNIYKNRMKFFQGDAGGGTGGGGEGGAPDPGAGSAGEVTRGATAFEPVPKTTTGDREPSTLKSPGPKGAETSPPPPPVEPKPTEGFDASKFAKEFGDSLSTTLKPILEKSQAAPEMTPEEARKLLNIWEPDDAWYAKYDNLETRKDAVASMRDALVRQADTLNQMRLQEAIDNLKSEFMPHMQAATQLANQQREERLAKQYPQLAKTELQPLLKAIAQDFVDKQKTFSSENEMFKALAGGVEAVLKVNNPEFKLEETGTSNGSEGRRGNQLPTMTPGGGGGTGRQVGGESKSDKPRGLAVFDKL